VTKLALGTVQFGLPYGVANDSGQVPLSEIVTILSRAAAGGMDTLDTAIGYGDAESSLGRAGIAGWRVITKLPALPADMSNIDEWVDAQVVGSLRRLKIDRLEALLLHRPADLLDKHGEKYRLALDRVKAAGVARAVGVSIYDPVELDALWPTWRPDIVQAPCSVLDRRLIRSGWLANLEHSRTRVHVRSVFLQGLLLMSAAQRPHSFSRWSALLTRWIDWCRECGTQPLQAALTFVKTLSGVERIVVGVDSATQLEEILIAAADATPLPPADLFSDDPELIEPSRWRQL